MSMPRGAGYISLNGVSYVVQKDPKSGDYSYARQSTPKKAVQSTRRNASTGQSNLLEVRFEYRDGMGSEDADDPEDAYHWATNLYMARKGEAVCLPGIRSLVPDEDDINMCWSPPVFVWEQTNSSSDIELFWLCDHRAFVLRDNAGMTVGIDEDMFFEGTTRPTGGTTFNNFAYAAMGGGQATKDRYIRRRDPTTGTWTNDDNDPKNITAVGNNGAGAARYTTSTVHGYIVGDVVFVTVTTGATAHAGLWTITAVTSTTTFDVAGDVSTATMTGTVNAQDTDVKAEQLCIVGDEMVRTYYSAFGWQTSRVDIVGSNELLSSNWTAGIGILNVGDRNSKPTALIPFGNGELVMKPEGVFQYDNTKGLYINVVPELEQHRHPDNGKGSFEYKGWVYIPTVIGLLRWKDSTLQDVTPGRFTTQGYDSPVGPIASIAGDANRLYAVTQPFNKNFSLEGENPTTRLAYRLLGADPITNTTSATDGLRDTYIDLNGLATSGFVYVGCSKQFHRVHAEINESGNTTVNGSTIAGEYFNGSTWVTRTLVYDGTRGWEGTDDDPTTLHQTGDITWDTPVNEASGEDDWALGSPLADAALDQTMYWMRFHVSAAITHATQLSVIFIGIHDPNLFMPYNTCEVPQDHGGVVHVLTMTEEQGKGVVWNTMWALVVPDNVRATGKSYGGAQKVGTCRVVQPRNGTIQGERYLFVGLQNISYLCPLGNQPDPTNAPFPQLYPATGVGIDGGVRPIQLVSPYTDFGLQTEPKTLKEIEFQSEGIDLSSVEVWYSQDHQPWVFAGYADDLGPDMPIVLPAGTEPIGAVFAVAFSYDPASERTNRLDRFFATIMRAQPRPEMAETVRMTIELEYDQQMPGGVKRRSPSNAYADLVALQAVGPTVLFKNLNGDSEYVHVLQVSQRAVHNDNNKPKLMADLIMAVSAPVVPETDPNDVDTGWPTSPN